MSLSSVGCGQGYKHTTAIKAVNPPRNKKELLNVFGMFNFFATHIKDSGLCLKLLTELLQKSRQFLWSQACQSAFEKVK